MSPMAEIRTLPVSCNYDCISGCPLEAVIRGGRIERIRNSPHGGSYMRGCLRGYLAHKVLYRPERLTAPLIREGRRGEGAFRRASWDEAVDYAAEGLRKIHDTHGAAAIMRIGGSGGCRGVVHHTARLTRHFLALSGGYTDIVGSYSSGATDFVKPYLFGTPYVGIDAKTLLYAKLIILWGFNAADTRFGTETEAVLEEAKRRNIPILCIDPRRTRTATRFCSDDAWIPLFPGSDAVLMSALLYVLIEEGLEDRDFIERYGSGFPSLEAAILGSEDGRPKDPAWASPRCGVPEETIIRLARRLAELRPAAILPGLSVQRTLGGEEADRMGAALQLALGNIGKKGGSAGAGQWNVLPHPRIAIPAAAENPAASSVPVYRWAHALLEPVERLERPERKKNAAGPKVRALYSVGGNYAVQGSDIGLNRRALGASEFTVCHDVFLTETCRWADVVFPAAVFLERRDVLTSHSNFLLYSERAAEPLEGVKTDYDIFSALAERLGFAEDFTEGLGADALLDRCIAESEVTDLASFRATGIYVGNDPERVGLSAFIDDPAHNPLHTPSGKIEIFSQSYAEAGGSPFPRALIEEADPSHPLRLISPHSPARVNSQFHAVPELERHNDDRLWINPSDARSRGIEENDELLVKSPVGRMAALARVTDEIMPGVVSFNQGAWPRPVESGIESGLEYGGVNFLTSTEPTMPSGSSRTHSVRVQVEKRI